MLQRLRDAVVTHWPIKLTALVLSTLLWAGVAAEQPTSQLVPVVLDVTPPGGRAITHALPTVRALVVGPARALMKLYGTPPTIHKIVPDTVSSSRFVLELAPGDVSFPESGAKVEDVQPRSIIVALNDTASLGRLRVTPRAVEVAADAAPESERVLMGVPVAFTGDRSGWESDPPAVIVTVRGPAARLQRLTRDSIVVIAVPMGRGTSETVHLDVVSPAGISATATPDTAVVQRRPRG